MKRTPAFALVAIIGTIADIVSKWFVFLKIREFETITLVPGLLNILRSQNEGVVFGLFPGKSTIFIIFSAIIIILILCMYFWSYKTLFTSDIALGLVLAGAAGNLWDRIWYKHVRDFIDLHIGEKYHWPTFNVADSLICIGISIMFFTSFLSERSKNKS
jgi:signal peptidase II